MARKSGTGRAKKKALEEALRGMFSKLQARPVPARLMSIVDQLDEADGNRLKKTGST